MVDLLQRGSGQKLCTKNSMSGCASLGIRTILYLVQATTLHGSFEARTNALNKNSVGAFKFNSRLRRATRRGANTAGNRPLRRHGFVREIAFTPACGKPRPRSSHPSRAPPRCEAAGCTSRGAPSGTARRS